MGVKSPSRRRPRLVPAGLRVRRPLPEGRDLRHAPAALDGREAAARRGLRARRRGRLQRTLARRIRGAAWLGLALACAGPVRAGAFSLDDVAKRAERQARAPFHDPAGEVPKWLTEISYDQWRDIRFRPELALWRDAKLPFQVQFFHPGLYYDRTVKVHVVDAQGTHPVPFNPSNFDYGRNDFGSRVPQD